MSVADWVYTAFPPFAPTLFPSTAFWNVSSVSHNMTYQVQVSWPFQWESREVSNKTALTMYVLDGNAMGMTASEGFKRRQPVAFGQPDSVVVSIGYALTDSVYDFWNRFMDYRPPRPDNLTQDYAPRADAFLDFLSTSLRPFIHASVFPNVTFTRDAVFGHSFGGLLVAYALLSRPRQFDTYLAASPALDWQNGTLFSMVTSALGTGPPDSTSLGGTVTGPCGTSANSSETLNKPAFFLSYGSLEEFPIRRRTETEEHFQMRKSYFRPLKMTDNCHELYDLVKGSGKTRDVVLKEYAGQDHAGVAASAITDGIDYFVDW